MAITTDRSDDLDVAAEEEPQEEELEEDEVLLEEISIDGMCGVY